MIRLVVLEKRRKQWRMPIRAEIPVPEGVIVDGTIKNPGATVELLKELMAAAGLKQRQAIVALPERHTFIKQFPLPADHVGSTDEAVHTEASQHLPYTWEEIYYDWQILGQPDTLGQDRIVFAAAPKVLVDSYLSVLDQAGIQTTRLEIESVAVAQACFRAAETGTHLLLDLGRTRSTVILLQDGAVIFSATVRYAGKELNRYIADRLRITLSQAERAKTIFGLDPKRGKGVLAKVLAPHLGVLVDKINDVLNFYQEHIVDHPPISTIGISGSGALLRGIDQALSKRLGRPVTRRPSWVYDQLHINDRQPFAELPYTYATAFGLALENVLDHAAA